MTCAAADTWILAARTADDLPERVRRHLSQCSRCAAQLDRLARVDASTAQLAPGTNPAARARLAAVLARTPQQPGRSPAEPVPTRPRTRGSAHRGALGLAAAILLLLGWLAGRLGAPGAVVRAPVIDGSPVAQSPALTPHPKPGPGLLAKVARQSSSVAADSTPSGQAEALYQIAADVRAEATKKAGVGDVEQLPRLIGLHNRVLKLGVARQLRRVPDQQRTPTTAKMVADLNQSADDVATAASRLPPAVGDSLRPLVTSCQEAGVALQQGKPTPADDWPSPATPLETLAAQTVRLSQADAPLARADESAQLATVLSQVVSVLAVGDLPDDAARVGEALDSVLEYGVSANLERVETSDPTGKLREDVAKVRERAGRATEVLERNLAKAPPAARAGLERALAASDPGRGKATGKGSGKPPGSGPPWKKGDGEHPGKSGIPPGWQKKP